MTKSSTTGKRSCMLVRTISSASTLEPQHPSSPVEMQNAVLAVLMLACVVTSSRRRWNFIVSERFIMCHVAAGDTFTVLSRTVDSICQFHQPLTAQSTAPHETSLSWGGSATGA